MAFAAGVDVSELETLQQHGAVYRDHGVAESPYTIFQNNGVNWMRIRLFVHPNGIGPLTNDLPYTVTLAKKIKKSGFHLLLDLHYSDSWADPAQQHVPKAWSGLSHKQLVEQVRRYTRESLISLSAADAKPDMVEIGNEITNGMMWEDGRVTPRSEDNTQWTHLSDLLKAGISGVNDAFLNAKTPQIMIHIDRGGDVQASRLFYDHILAHGVRFDVIGLSDYPWWQGSLQQLAANLSSLAGAYHKPIIVVETGFPWSPQAIGTSGHNYDAKETEKQVLHFPATPDGQAQYLQQLIATVRATPGGLGDGVFYWAAAWIHNTGWGPPTWSKDWEYRALFDENGNALPALYVLGEAGRSSLTQASTPTNLQP
jgi:arabinogalactan endo-1,4-beta-galactosidase